MLLLLLPLFLSLLLLSLLVVVLVTVAVLVVSQFLQFFTLSSLIFQSIVTAEGDRFLESHVDESLQNIEIKVVRWLEGEKMVVVSI